MAAACGRRSLVMCQRRGRTWDGAVVQQGEPQGILLNPCDPYIEDFVSDINRARVLRVRSVMSAVSEADIAGEVDADKSLEDLIKLSDGDTNHIYRVTENGETIGQIDMNDVRSK